MAAKTLRILHFNDVYNIAERSQPPCGGVPRFATLLEQRQRQAAEDGVACITCFSGDALYPSTLSTLTNARQMVDALNLLMPEGVASVGNHDGKKSGPNNEHYPRLKAIWS
jgi:2',3'-cyclic-nucleotide 2'-phosphodiesterase (5'-nucleotidase family)